VEAQGVAVDAVAVATRDRPLDLREVALGQLLDPPASGADQMVVMALAAEAVRGLAVVVADRVQETRPRERPEGPVDGREAELRAVIAREAVHVGRAQGAVLGGEGPEHRHALGGALESARAHPLHGGLVQGGRHGGS
jgi:hypothetical protein